MLVAHVGLGGMLEYKPPDTTGGDPCEGEWCKYNAAVERLYLYDGGVLLATFDKNDNVVDLYVNGPTGRLATYFQNNTYFLYYYVNDHLGNARVLVNGSGQAQYYVYYPFGQVIEASGTHGTEFQFTGKERDDHGNFEFDYFGARYYDSRVGSFTTIDKASQFASGYIYGANNPISTIDPDGDFAFLAALGWALKVYYVGKATYEGYKEGSWWGALKNYYIASWTVQVADAAGEWAKRVSPLPRLGRLAASSGTYSVGNRAMYGTDYQVNVGFGTWNLSRGSFQVADWRGRTFVDKMCATWGWFSTLEDMNPYLSKSVNFLGRQAGLWDDPVYELNSPYAEKIRERAQRTADERWHSVDENGNPAEHPSGEHVKDVRYLDTGGGGLHRDEQGGMVRYHLDRFGGASWNGTNWGTQAHHVLFEAGPDKIMRTWLHLPEIARPFFFAHYYLYENQNAYWQARKRGAYVY